MEQKKEEILSTLKEIATEKLELDIGDVDLGMHVVDDLGLNSLTIFDFIYEIEKTFAIELEEKKLLRVKTVADIIDLIHSNLQ